MRKALYLAALGCLFVFAREARAQYGYYQPQAYGNYGYGGGVPVIPVQPLAYTSFYSPQMGTGYMIGPGFTSITSPYGTVQTFNPRVNAGGYGYGGYGGGYRYHTGAYGHRHYGR